MSEKKKSNASYARWLPKPCHIDGKRCVGVTVAKKVGINGRHYDNVVTIELYGFDSEDPEDDPKPEIWGGSESATLRPDGARALAKMLIEAADKADALLAEKVG